ncbi:MAG: hypothetical protein CVV42_04465 [Candidatus Riflebacteria bacterium HGW-Riflebacteria-2]|nr:MAG: hypothetical protein CVV42_04465 [Candidatus Riflebacteria bacterium HGW-Riflebacteria-2]
MHTRLNLQPSVVKLTVSNNARRNGMALVIVLAFSSVLLVLGVVYLRSFSQTTQISRMQIDHLQAEFFARGIQNIALFKIKRFPDFFLRSYRYHIYKKRRDAGDPLVEPPIRPFEAPTPFEKFTGVHAGRPNDILHHLAAGDDADWQFTAPLNIATWSTSFNLRSSEDFNRAYIEIDVHVQMQGNDNVAHYRMSLDASQTSQL